MKLLAGGRAGRGGARDLCAATVPAMLRRWSAYVFLLLCISSRRRCPVDALVRPAGVAFRGGAPSVPLRGLEDLGPSTRRLGRGAVSDPATEDDGGAISVGVTGPAEGGERKTPGRPHTDQSRAKISAANKGKTPWNKGRRHDPATIEKIRQKTREAMERRKREALEKEAGELGITVAELEERKEAEKLEKKRKKSSGRANGGSGGKGGGLSEEARKRMSERMKARWQDPEYRAKALKNLEKVRKNETLQVEIRAKISATLKKRWAEDPEYRQQRSNNTISDEARAKMAETLRRKWKEDDAFREKMLDSFRKRSVTYTDKISETMRQKWQDPEYREKTLRAMDAYYSGDGTNEKRRSSRQKSSRAANTRRTGSRRRSAGSQGAGDEGAELEEAPDFGAIFSSLSPAERVKVMQSAARDGSLALPERKDDGNAIDDISFKTPAQLAAEKEELARQRENRLEAQRLRRLKMKEKKAEENEEKGGAASEEGAAKVAASASGTGKGKGKGKGKGSAKGKGSGAGGASKEEGAAKKPRASKKKAKEEGADEEAKEAASDAPARKKAATPEEEKEQERMNRIRQSNPDLWAALYADDDEVQNMYPEETLSDGSSFMSPTAGRRGRPSAQNKMLKSHQDAAEAKEEAKRVKKAAKASAGADEGKGKKDGAEGDGEGAADADAGMRALFDDAGLADAASEASDQQKSDR